MGDRPIYVICNTGHRSGLASSIFLRSRIQAVNVLGGMKAWIQMKYPTVRKYRLIILSKNLIICTP
ncbi:MAG: rhodanese-like domain-containing protein [Candidatus Contubernalis sp.]|nr:rhodanese-like domain-containing protein [Candidatus Contubernalis sp.]